MDDMDFIAETMRDIGATYLSDDARRAILSAPKVDVVVFDETDMALRRRAIVAETMAVFDADPDTHMDVYQRVWIAVRNIANGWQQCECSRGRRVAA